MCIVIVFNIFCHHSAIYGFELADPTLAAYLCQTSRPTENISYV